MNHPVAFGVTLALAVASAIFFIWVRYSQKPVHGLLAKTLASILFVTMGAVAVTLNSVPSAPLFVLGLALGMAGDILLDLKRAGKPEDEGLYLVSGEVAFALGHAAYLAGALLYVNADLLLPTLVCIPIAALLAGGSMVMATKTMNAKFGKFTGISFAYAMILSYMTVLSIWLAILDTRLILMAVGMVLFLLSDLVLSMMYFVEGKKEDKMLMIVNHVLYYGAQIVIASLLFFM